MSGPRNNKQEKKKNYPLKTGGKYKQQLQMNATNAYNE